MLMMSHRDLSKVAVLAWAAFALTGCASSDPTFDKACSARRQSIEALLQMSNKRDIECQANLQLLNRDIAKTHELHCRELRLMREYLAARQRAEVASWPDDWQTSEDEIAKRMRGEPENISKVIPLLFY